MGFLEWFEGWFMWALPWCNVVILVYYVIINGTYFSLLFTSSLATEQHRRANWADPVSPVDPTTAPPVSVVVPAFNEASNIVESITSLLNLSYVSHEVIVIDDGSTDDTLQRLIDAFELVEVDLIYRAHIPTQPVKRFFVNPDMPELTVVTKDNSGKADSLNVGINLSRSPYFCSVDADSLLERNALSRLMSPILADPEQVVATGGIIRIANGCTVRNGQVDKVRLPKDFLSRLQVLEYLRCFLFGRTGWSVLGSVMILSGTFSLFHKRSVMELGGYMVNTVSEDMELVVHLHRHMRARRRPYRITFVADPVCWTEAPTTLKQLGRQRRRWHQGMAETLWEQRGMLFNPRYGIVGLLGFPFQLVELFAPVIELLGYILVILSTLFGVLSPEFLMLYLILSLLMGIFLSVGSILLEELTERGYPRWRELWILLLYAVLENFGYRQMAVIWRVRGFINALGRRKSWEVVKKSGFARQQEQEAVPVPEATP